MTTNSCHYVAHVCEEDYLLVSSHLLLYDLFMYWWSHQPPSEEVPTSFSLRIHFYPQSWNPNFRQTGEIFTFLLSKGFVIFARTNSAPLRNDGGPAYCYAVSRSGSEDWNRTNIGRATIFRVNQLHYSRHIERKRKFLFSGDYLLETPLGRGDQLHFIWTFSSKLSSFLLVAKIGIEPMSKVVWRPSAPCALCHIVKS